MCRQTYCLSLGPRVNRANTSIAAVFWHVAGEPLAKRVAAGVGSPQAHLRSTASLPVRRPSRGGMASFECPYPRPAAYASATAHGLIDATPLALEVVEEWTRPCCSAIYPWSPLPPTYISGCHIFLFLRLSFAVQRLLNQALGTLGSLCWLLPYQLSRWAQRFRSG